MNTETDESLMQRFALGDGVAFETLYARHKGWLHRALRHQIGSVELAADIFQDTWMALIKAAPSYQPTAKFSTWLYLLARQRLIDTVRKQRSRGQLPQKPENGADTFNEDETAPDIPDSALAPHVLAERAQLGQALAQALEQLPSEQCEVFVLSYEGLTIEEIALATNQPHEATKSRLRYARNKLKAALVARFGPQLSQQLSATPQAQWTGTVA